MAAIPVPPQHGYNDAHHGDIHSQGHQARGDNMDPLEDLLKNMTLDGGKSKKANKKIKIKIPIEPEYEGYILTRIPARSGEKQTWAKVGKQLMPFDSQRLYKIAAEHRQRTGRNPSDVFKELLDHQRGIIDRLIAEKMRDERDPDAIWVLFDVSKIKKDIPQGFFRVDREVVNLQVILRRQEKATTSAVDRTAGNTTAAYTFGDIIDLTKPMKEVKKDNKNKKSKEESNDHDFENDDDLIATFFGDQPTGGHGGHSHHVDSYGQDHQPYAQQDPYHAGHYDQHNQFNHRDHQQQWPQQQLPVAGAIPVPQHQQVPPQAPMAPDPFYNNPFAPQVGVPAQYEFPPTLPGHPEDQAHFDYSPRRRHHSRSHSRSRSNPRRGHRHHWNVPSIGSVQSVADDGIWSPAPNSDFTPPSTPDREEAFPVGSLHRRYSSNSRRQHYDQARHTRYPDERGVIQPGVSHRPGRDYNRYPTERDSRRRRPVVSYDDDYPASRRPRALIEYPDALDDADYGRRSGRRDDGVDYLRSDGRRERRYDNASRGPRRYSGTNYY